MYKAAKILILTVIRQLHFRQLFLPEFMIFAIFGESSFGYPFLVSRLCKLIDDKLAGLNKNLFIQNGQLNVERILERFVVYFDDIYGGKTRSYMLIDYCGVQLIVEMKVWQGNTYHE